MHSGLSISVLGELVLTRDGQSVTLPPSRKTRALLAYLVLSDRPHRRERLCEMFWDIPDDPRGSLRWALSKIRGVIGADLVLADRERVALALPEGAVDLDRMRGLIGAGSPDAISLDGLRQAVQALSQPALDGLELSQSDLWLNWLTGIRAETASLWQSAMARLLQHPDRTDADVLRWAGTWLLADPLAVIPARALVQVLRRTGKESDAQAVAQAFRTTALAAGISQLPDLDAEPVRIAPDTTQLHQSIGYCQAADGARIAYASVGKGPPLVKAANWLNHLELDWQSPIWGRTFETLAARNQLIRYDERGNGLSDWEVPEISQAAFVRDLETVVNTLNLKRFPLIGMSQGCAVSIEYAVRHPDRVSALILIGGYAAGWRIAATPEERERREAVMTLTRLGWGTSTAAYRHIFSQTFMPDGTPEDLAWFDEFQRLTTSADNAYRFQDAFGDIDVRHLLAEVAVPTLVLHAREDQRIRLDQGRDLAMSIRGARFVTLESRNHILLGHEPAWAVAMAEIERFLDEYRLR
jgi:pimeloyl-ACP methyl ester carboxylesterase/DNA-binding SARP family transcriptional activator